MLQELHLNKSNSKQTVAAIVRTGHDWLIVPLCGCKLGDLDSRQLR